MPKFTRALAAAVLAAGALSAYAGPDPLALPAHLLSSLSGVAAAQAPTDPAAPAAGAPAGEAAAPAGDAAAAPADPAAAPADPAAAPADPAAAPAAEGEKAAAQDTASAAAAAAEGAEGAEGAEEDEEEESPWSTGLMMSMFALTLGGFSAVLGIWVDRDKSRPARNAWVMSVLILLACAVGASQGYLDAVGAIQGKADLNRMLGMVVEIAKGTNDVELAKLLVDQGVLDKATQDEIAKAKEEADKAAAEAAAAEGAEGAEGEAGAEGAEGEAAPAEGEAAPAEGAPAAGDAAPTPAEGAPAPAPQ
ncbi:MAG: hypothetical protein JNM72_20760 [Deltaproteobacteria bacterium]|jgi:hypothetical protein|nr:hypothetical protein [Deltaproteobacteria bacterium]